MERETAVNASKVLQNWTFVKVEYWRSPRQPWNVLVINQVQNERSIDNGILSFMTVIVLEMGRQSKSMERGPSTCRGPSDSTVKQQELPKAPMTFPFETACLCRFGVERPSV